MDGRKNLKQGALLNLLGIAGIITGTSAVVALDILNMWAFILVAIACIPMAKKVWEYVEFMRNDPLRILPKALPKAGFSIENTEWNDDHTVVKFHGNYQGDNFFIEVDINSAYVFICDKPWHFVYASNPQMLRLMEAVNEVNAGSSNMSVIICEPNEEGIRMIYTLCKTIIPSFRPAAYLDHLMCDMLNCKNALSNAFHRERSYMTQRRSTVGFATSQQHQENVEVHSPAAQNDPKLKN